MVDRARHSRAFFPKISRCMPTATRATQNLANATLRFDLALRRSPLARPEKGVKNRSARPALRHAAVHHLAQNILKDRRRHRDRREQHLRSSIFPLHFRRMPTAKRRGARSDREVGIGKVSVKRVFRHPQGSRHSPSACAKVLKTARQRDRREQHLHVGATVAILHTTMTG